jgi:hypothetical protein
MFYPFWSLPMFEFAKKLIQRKKPETRRPEALHPEARRPEALREGGDSGLTVSCHHLPPDAEAIVRDWFAGRITTFTLSGDRSVYIPQASAGHPQIKIKGAGMRGGAIQFGTYLKSGPVAPLFDYDGRRMEDMALGHDGAMVGGASMQQAVTEWRMTQRVQSLGYRAIPCHGYGSVFDGQHRSWFSVFGWDDTWRDSVKPPMGTVDTYRDLSLQASEITLALARDHGIVGFLWLIRDADGTPMLKDLHPFRQMDPMNMSQVSWVMQVCHALHITAINTRILSKAWFGDDAPKEAPLWLFSSVCPDVTLADWDQLRFSVVAKYMINSHPEFSTEALLDLLEANPITARLMALCPPEFAPVR